MQQPETLIFPGSNWRTKQMSDYHPNITAEEYITSLHITISHVDDNEMRSELIDYLNAIKDQIQCIEH